MRHTLYEVLSDTDQSAILNIESKILDLRKDLISANDKEKKEINTNIDTFKADIDSIKKRAER